MYVDALALLVDTLALPHGSSKHATIGSYELHCLKMVLKVNELYNRKVNFKSRDWHFTFIDYTLYDILPDDPKEAASIKRKTAKFYHATMLQTTYHKSQDGVLRRCLL